MVNRKLLKKAIIVYSIVFVLVGFIYYIGLSLYSYYNPGGNVLASFSAGMGAFLACQIFFFLRLLRGKNGKVRFELED